MSSYLDLTASTPGPISLWHKSDPWERRHHNSQEDGYSTEDEEDVLYDLDEIAMAQLPLHLQNNMREVHLERTRRLQRENNSTTFRKKAFHVSLPAFWYRNTMARAATKLNIVKCGYGGLPNLSLEQADWNPCQSTDMMYEEMHTQCGMIATVDNYSYRSSEFFGLSNDIFWKHSTSTEGCIEAGSANDRRSSSKYLSESSGA
ncbi:hypothetical protein BDV29DRAFT_152326 [Aspergillus leporis]|jgi:hypothetical protein|uniref:Uncharacterized protein n=1 Tax=Aspergillus leporis TaxID=41062 RepID=A0A5N5XHC2_9EURO|nr:hypothetical protein BDV29DRAFT_152326 [Aspergillus leporis]